MTKKYFIEDFPNSIGLTGESVFALVKKIDKKTKGGAPYMDIKLQDRSGSINAKVWSDSLANVKNVNEGDVVIAEFEVRDYQGRIDLTVRSLKTTDDFSSQDLVPVPEGLDFEDLKKELARRIDSIRDFNLRKLIDAFFDDEEFRDQFCRVPAAEVIHHHYQHGLLQHSLEMLEIADAFCKTYPDLDKDLVTTGILLHDIGKTKENIVNVVGVARRTVPGRLIGHISLGFLMIHDRLPEDFPSSLKTKIDHIILSHQGRGEWGSPVSPATREAMAVHMADMASTYMRIVDKARTEGIKKVKDKDKINESFSEYNKYLETVIYLGE